MGISPTSCTDVHVYAVDRPGFGLSDPFDYRHVDMSGRGA
jgi:pimeloyl-ACP methyl ester carboxylesterase